MKRRVNIAAGLLHEPQLLVLDEPTVGVDPQSRNQILDSVETLGGEGLSVLYTTHYMEEAERLCDRVGVLDHGVMIAEGTQDELIARVGEQDLIIVSGDYDEALVRACGALAGVDRAEMTGRGLEVLTADGTCGPGPAGRAVRRTRGRDRGLAAARTEPRGGLPRPHRSGTS